MCDNSLFMKSDCQRNDMLIMYAIEVYFYIVLHLLCASEGLKPKAILFSGAVKHVTSCDKGERVKKFTKNVT